MAISSSGRDSPGVFSSDLSSDLIYSYSPDTSRRWIPLAFPARQQSPLGQMGHLSPRCQYGRRSGSYPGSGYTTRFSRSARNAGFRYFARPGLQT